MSISSKKAPFVEPKLLAKVEKMNETEFNTLYNNVRDILFKAIIPNISKEEFERNLVNFL